MSRAGYDVTEVMWIKEATFGSTPTSGEWLHAGNPIGFDPRHRPIYKRRIGLGRQYPSAFDLVKKYAELTLEYELMKKDTTIGSEYEWTELIAYIFGETGNAATITLEKHISPLSIGAKLDLATDEFFLLAGSKLTEIEIRSAIEEVVSCRASTLSQKMTHGTVDYVSGTATRKTFPTTDPIYFSDLDLTYKGSSILDSIQNFAFRIRRDIQRRGSDSTDKKLYRAFEEQGLSIEFEITRDFNSTTELTDFLGDTAFNVNIDIPSGSGGRRIELSGGKWQELAPPKRELELINVTLRAEFAGCQISTIA